MRKKQRNSWVQRRIGSFKNGLREQGAIENGENGEKKAVQAGHITSDGKVTLCVTPL